MGHHSGERYGKIWDREVFTGRHEQVTIVPNLSRMWSQFAFDEQRHSAVCRRSHSFVRWRPRGKQVFSLHDSSPFAWQPYTAGLILHLRHRTTQKGAFTNSIIYQIRNSRSRKFGIRLDFVSRHIGIIVWFYSVQYSYNDLQGDITFLTCCNRWSDTFV